MTVEYTGIQPGNNDLDGLVLTFLYNDEINIHLAVPGTAITLLTTLSLNDQDQFIDTIKKPFSKQLDNQLKNRTLSDTYFSIQLIDIRTEEEAGNSVSANQRQNRINNVINKMFERLYS